MKKDNLLFNWLDIASPTMAHLQEIAVKYQLPETMVKDCLQAKHLPKFEQAGNWSFIIIRVYDPNAPQDDFTIQNVTTKIAIFYRPEFLITIHRRKQPFMKELRDDWEANPGKYTSLKILSKIIYGGLTSFDGPLEELSNAYDKLEKNIFLETSHVDNIKTGYPIRRKVYLFRKLIKLTLEVLKKTKSLYEGHETFIQDLVDHIRNLAFQIDDLRDNMNNLLNLEIGIISQKTSQASNKTNDIIKFLTIFSMLFMPPTLLVGIYGMNFQHMPELNWEWGYPTIWVLMVAMSIGMYAWFKRKHWL